MTTAKRRPKMAMVDVGAGTQLPADVEHIAHTEAYTVSFTATYDRDSGRYRVRTLTIEATGGGEVTGEMLRTVRVADLLALRLHAVARDTAALSLPPVAIDGAGESTFRGMDLDNTLKYVAAFYRRAVALGLPPTQTVAAQMGVPRATAGRWVTRARDRGLLTVVDKRAGRKEA